MRNFLDLARIQGLFFDIDGTLADTDDALIRRLVGLLRPVSRLIPGAETTALARRLILATETPANTAYALADRLGLDDLAGPLLDLFHRLRGEGRPHRFLLVAGVREALHQLSCRYPLAIVSARDRRGAEAFLEQFELRSLFRCVVSARTCRRTKPHPAPVRWAAASLNLPPQACVMIGDTTVDITAGRAAGCQTIGVLCGFGERAELSLAGADLILESPVGLVPLLLGAADN